MSCCVGEKILPGCGGSPGPGPPGRGTNGAKTRLDLFLLCRGQHSVKTAVNRLLESNHVFLLVVRQFQTVLFGAVHDLAGLRRRIEPVAAWVSRPFRGLLFLIGCEQLIQVGVDVFLDLVELLPLVGGDLQHFPRD